MKAGKVRPLALCVFRHEGRILVAQGHDRTRDHTFYRPLGGRIEFGERGAETVVRELREEIDADIKVDRYLGLLENIFTYEGQPGHEIVLVYEGHFLDPAILTRESVEGRDDDQPLFTAYWLPLTFFTAPAAPPLYPDGLLELLLTTSSE
ncbi:MAG: NUDIX hydrolase [Anaerolineae bacterium]|nr:NUDIX hydrolase [Anaerolineae bacterium]